MQKGNIFDYNMMVEQALRGVVAEALKRANETGLPGNHHFYISFRTEFPGVEMAAYLRARYPEDMTIVLQHQFWGLEPGKDGFAVTLSFNKVPERLYVPYAAITSFADPSVQFGLQFRAVPEAAGQRVARAGQSPSNQGTGQSPATSTSPAQTERKDGADAAKAETGKADPAKIDGLKADGSKADAARADGSAKTAGADKAEAAAKSGEVVALDAFRKKR